MKLFVAGGDIILCACAGQKDVTANSTGVVTLCVRHVITMNGSRCVNRYVKDGCVVFNENLLMQ